MHECLWTFLQARQELLYIASCERVAGILALVRFRASHEYGACISSGIFSKRPGILRAP
jgi:hypothetical protein